MDAMRSMPDNAFDLAVCDPPYGGGGYQTLSGASVPASADCSRNTGFKLTRTGGTWSKKYQAQPGGVFSHDIRHWDIPPPDEYFTQLFRVSRNQIIWGGNYFRLPPCRCFLVWRKLTISENFSMAMCEYAWTSFNDNAKYFEFPPQGNKENRFHPTQKPVALYAWIFSRFAKPGDKILDTHLGSGSSRIAAYDAGLDFTGYEIDAEYFRLQEERFAKHAAQCSLFVD